MSDKLQLDRKAAQEIACIVARSNRKIAVLSRKAEEYRRRERRAMWRNMWLSFVDGLLWRPFRNRH